MSSADQSSEQDTEVDGSPGAERIEELPAGSKIGRYVLLGLRAKGGMGLIYEAHDPELHRGRLAR